MPPHTCGRQRTTFGNCSHLCSQWVPEIARLAQQALFPLNLLPAKEGFCLLESGWKSILFRYSSIGIHSLVLRQQLHLRFQAPKDPNISENIRMNPDHTGLSHERHLRTTSSAVPSHSSLTPGWTLHPLPVMQRGPSWHNSLPSCSNLPGN